ncbi:hypothetical protein [Aeromicrobium stalagmiti]|uniref:hypothetical protein n=1 Tax=Aeromicrobium stalagmiti TaxID=2738988 RepID=UPI001568D24F|nr:hypothetical protein [Aeromicrobium stalagmiti]NRQ49556.1 hypothetical protein [Aeromicrobium stalagmiti]
MIIDPLTFVPLELDRRLAAARAAQAYSERAGAAGRRRPRRSLVLRLAAWATGRTVHA